MFGRYFRGIKRRFLLVFTSIVNKISTWLDGVKIEKGVHLNGVVNFINDGEILIKTKTTINSGAFFNPIGGATRCIFHTFPNAQICVGVNCGISNAAIVSAEKIIIGNHVKIGGDVKIYDTDFHTLDFSNRREPRSDLSKTAAVEIKDDVFIGTGCIVLKGVTIGERSIIAAGSVVTGDVPPDQLWGGNPCKFIRNLNNH